VEGLSEIGWWSLTHISEFSDLGGQPYFPLKVWMQLWGHRLNAYNVQDNALKYIWRHPNEDGQMNTCT